MNPPFMRDYPATAFYNLSRDAVLEIAEKVKAPLGIIAPLALAVKSICTQGLFDVMLPDGRVCPLSVYMNILAESGDGKTGSENLLNKAVVEHDRKMVAKFKEAMIDFHAKAHLWEIDDNELRRELRRCRHDGEKAMIRQRILAHAKNRPVAPRCGRILYQDASERPFREALEGEGASIAIVSDEASAILDRGVMLSHGLLNTIFSGAQSLPFDRAGKDFADVKDPRLTISMQLQPDAFEKHMGKHGELARATGHFARFLFSFPYPTKGTRWMDMRERVWQHLPAFHTRVTELLNNYDAMVASGTCKREVLEFSPEAKEEWVRVFNRIEADQGPGGPLHHISDFASKSMEIVGRVAGIFHAFSGQTGAISRETVQRAMDVVGWHMDTYLYLFGGPRLMPQSMLDVQGLMGYLYRKYWNSKVCNAPRNDVYKSGPIRHRGRFDAALTALVAQGAIWIGTTKTGRHYINLVPLYFERVVLPR